MLLGSSRPPLLSGTMWSTSQSLQPGGFGWIRLNPSTAFGLRLICPWLSRAQVRHLIVLWGVGLLYVLQ